MNLLDSEVEIVGFNGRPLVECGRALPVARRKSDGNHCIVDLTTANESLHWHSEEEANHFAAETRWTMFRSPLNVPKRCMTNAQSTPVQPIVVYTNQKLLDNADRQFLPESWHDEYLIWKKLIELPDDVHATCATASAVTTLMNHWAEGLLRRFDAMLRIGRDHEYLLRIADFALCAANDRSQRWETFLRYSIAQKPDKVKRTFETIIGREFSSVTWEAFIESRGKLTDILNTGLVAPFAQPNNVIPSMSSSYATALTKVRGVAAVPPTPISQLIKQ